MKIYINVSKEDGRVFGWGDQPSPDAIEMEVEENDPFLLDPFLYRYRDFKFFKDESIAKEMMKSRVHRRLDEKCKETILGRFVAQIDEKEYWFSYDEEAQGRFNGVPYLFTSGMITEVEWTAYDEDGKRTSVVLNKEKFDYLAGKAFLHQMTNISKFRKKIEELGNCETAEEMNQITW
jgi:hypothetical protein